MGGESEELWIRSGIIGRLGGSCRGGRELRVAKEGWARPRAVRGKDAASLRGKNECGTRTQLRTRSLGHPEERFRAHKPRGEEAVLAPRKGETGSGRNDGNCWSQN